MARKILLTVYSILFLSPLISFVIGSAVAEDTLDTGIETTVDTSDIAENSEWTGSEVVYTLTIDGAIGAVTAERIEDLIEIAEENDAELVIIKLNTPGGFTNWTWTISRTESPAIRRPSYSRIPSFSVSSKDAGGILRQ